MSSQVLSVLMPVFNGMPYIAESIQSVLAQTHDDFELMILDDGSSDGTRPLLEDYARQDPRITLFLSDRNRGIACTLNDGLAHCRGEFIAQMHADDICSPRRFQRQIQFMRDCPAVGACGTWFTTFGMDSATYKHPLSDEEIKIHHLLRNTAICNPSAMVRRSVLMETRIQYVTEEVPAEDLWFWIRLGFVTRLANIDESLLFYRIHPQQASMRREPTQRSVAAARLFFAENVLNRQLSDEEKQAHHALSGEAVITTLQDLSRIGDYAAHLEAGNDRSRLLDSAHLHAALKHSLAALPLKYAQSRYKHSTKYDLSLLRSFISDPFRPFRRLTPIETFKFVVKCVIRHIPSRGNN